MINLIKMTIYRLFKTKSLYIIMGVLAFLVVFMTFMVNGIGDVNSGDEITILDTMAFTHLFVGIVSSIFAVVFTSTDANTGYIKNIGGQAAVRSSLIIAKAAALFLSSAIFVAEFFIVQSIANLIIVGDVKVGDIGQFVGVVIFSILLHFALSLICMMLAILIKKSAIAMTLSVVLGFHMTESLLYEPINMMVNDGGSGTFDIANCMLMGNISNIVSNVSNSNFGQLVAVSVGYAVVAVIITCIVFEKRDIV